MPRIPFDLYGTVTPRAAPQVDQSPATDAAQRLGQTGINLAAQLQAKRDEEADQRARSAAANALLDDELQARTLGDDIADQVTTGRLEPERALEAFDAEAGKLKLPEIKGLDPVAFEGLQRGRERTRFQVRQAVERSVEVETRRRGQASVESALDTLGKLASRPDADVAAINARGESLRETARLAGVPDDVFSRALAGFQESNWVNHAQFRIMEARDNPGALRQLEQELTEGDLSGRIDGDKRNVLLGRVEAQQLHLQQQAAIAEERAQRQYERRMREAEAEYTMFQAQADKGTLLDPDYTARALARTAGTPFAEGIRALARQSAANGGLASQPIRVQQASLDAIDREIAARGRSPELDARREQVAKVLAGSQADLGRDGLRAALERGLLTDLAPVNLTNAAALGQGIAARARQAAEVSQWAGRPVSPLLPEEAATLGTLLKSLPPADRAAYMASLSRSVGGPQMRALSGQLMGGSNISLAVAGVLASRNTTAGRNVAQIYFEGVDAFAQGRVKNDQTTKDLKAKLYEQLGPAYRSRAELDAAVNATLGVWAGLSAEGDADMDRAVRLATGGVTEHNGTPTVVPYGMTEDDFADRVQRVTPYDLTQQQGGRATFRIRTASGSQAITARDLAMRLPNAQLQVYGDGTYTVTAGGAAVLGEDGRPFVLDLRNVGRSDPRPAPAAEPMRDPEPEPAPVRQRTSTPVPLRTGPWGIDAAEPMQ